MMNDEKLKFRKINTDLTAKTDGKKGYPDGS